MALFQPSNIIPSSFGGINETTVDVNDNIEISWQVNGNSPMTKFNIQIRNNATDADIGLHTISSGYNLPFNGVDNKGNPVQYTYKPENITWASWNLTNNKEYKMIITQYWKEGGTTKSITQYSGSVFKTREKPTLTIQYNGNDIVNPQAIDNATATFTATYTQAQNDAINAVRWVLKNATGEIIDDTGFINTSVLSYTYDGFFPNTYTIQCSVETVNKVLVSTPEITLNVSYTEAEVSGKLQIQCLEDGSNLLQWGKATNIMGEMSDSSEPFISDGYLTLSDGQNAVWDTVDDNPMSFNAPYSLAWKGKLGSITTLSTSVSTSAAETTQTQRIQKTQSDYSVDDINSSSFREQAIQFNGVPQDGKIIYGNGLYVWVNSYAQILYSTDGQTWTLNETIKSVFSANPYIAYGNGYFVIGREFTGATSPAQTAIAWYSTDAITWTPITSGLSSKRITGIGYGNGRFIFCVNNWSYDYYFFYTYSAPNFTQGSIGGSFTPDKGITSKNRIYYINANYFACLGGEVVILSSFSHRVILTIPEISRRNYYNFSMAYGNNKYMVSYDRLYITTSISSPSWTYTDVPNNGIVSDLVFSRGYFLAIKSQANYSPEHLLYCSIDGETWKPFEKTTNIWRYSSANIFLALNNNEYIFSNTAALGFIDIYYKTIQTISFSDDKTAYNWSYSSQSNIKNVSVSINNSAHTATATVDTYEPLLDLTLTLNLRSNSSTGSKTISFTRGTIAACKIIYKSPSTATYTLTYTANQITISGVSVPSGGSATTTVQFRYAVIYNNLIQGGQNGQNIIVLNSEQSGEIAVKLFDNFVLSGTGFEYGLSLYQNNSLIQQKTLQPYYMSSSGSYEILGKIFLTNNKMALVLYGESVADSVKITQADIIYTQTAITSVQLTGAQVDDYLYIESGTINIDENFTPNRNENTLFYASFDNEAEDLQAGTVSTTGEYKNAIYLNEGNGVLKPIAKLATSITIMKDYTAKSRQSYTYDLFYLANSTGYSKPEPSEQICRVFNTYTLIEATQYSEELSDYPNLYHVIKVWRFGNNISAGSISNNNSPNWLTNFTPYRLRQPSSRLGESGTLQALLANYNQSANFYEDTVKMMQELKQASVSRNTFFLKDMKGNLYMVGISAPITQTINTKSKIQEVMVSVPWEEVGDASNVSLIQLETDSGWQG